MTAEKVPDWRRLHELMLAAGFTEAGRGRGHVRLGWPGSPESRGTLVLCTDPTAPEYLNMLDAALDELAAARDRGAKARDVLEQLRTEGIIT